MNNEIMIYVYDRSEGKVKGKVWWHRNEQGLFGENDV
jgi:hypothetical protein